MPGALRTAVAMSMSEPASRPSSSTHMLSATEIGRPCSLNALVGAPTLGMASVTSMKRSRRLLRMAIRSTTGSTWWPSTMMPHQLSGSSSAAPTAPGSRPVSCDMALNRCVKPRSP